jgi:drug/metabolite transporter (DMT)-like permease
MLSANMSVKHGIDVHTTNAMRYSVALVFLFLFQRIRRQSMKLPPRERYISLFLGITVFMMGVGYLGATQYIPISLAVLIFYTFPMFVAVISRFTENEIMTKMRLIAIIIAFIGLGLALEVGSITRLNWQGVAYGFLAAMGCTSFIIVNSISMRTVDPQSVNFHCLSGGALLFWVFLLFTDSQTITLSQPVMLKMVLSGISLTFAYITFFTGVEIVGPVRGAMLLNMEPILTIILAAVLLGERLSILQLSGALLVIAGIVMIARTKNA